MRTIKNPSQTLIFDPIDDLPKVHRNAFIESPEGLFRAAILEALPVSDLAKNFSGRTGAPTKELYSMAGVVLMMEYNNWTAKQAVDEFMWNRKVQLALNINGTYPTFSERTLYRYLGLFADNDNDLANKAMTEVTKALIEIGELDVSKQRLDSTHVFSNMATFGRTRMMGVTIKRFITQVIRQDKDAYEKLDEELRNRYKPSQGKLFADTSKSKDKERHSLLRAQVAEDMFSLIGIFENHKRLSGATSFKSLVQVFGEQCELIGDEIKIRKKTGGKVIQNPSDPDATYSGHKGSGYQAQFAETCSEDNEVQLLTSVIPETAADSDMDAIEPVLDDLESNDLLPDSMLADAGYGSDKNVEHAAEKNVELVSPTKENSDPSASKGEIANTLTIDDFVFDEATEEVITCPAGHCPTSSTNDKDTGKTKTIMPEEACSACDFSGECPVKRKNGTYQLEHTSKARRLAARRREEVTDEFCERYAKRAGIESTNSGIKQVTGLGQLRVRGMPRVSMAIILKAAGWNILRASACGKIMDFVKNRLQERVLSTEIQYSGIWLRFLMPLEAEPLFENQKIAA